MKASGSDASIGGKWQRHQAMEHLQRRLGEAPSSGASTGGRWERCRAMARLRRQAGEMASRHIGFVRVGSGWD